jgi:membrane protein DedA with SNARE-associated domain
LGHFNIFFIILIAIAGDLTADVIYYFIGYQSRSTIIESHGHRFGLTRSRMEKIEHLVQHHFKKTMVVIKLSPFLPVPGLIAIGASRVSLRRFVEMSLIITAPKAIFFALLGFYSGKTYMYLTQTVTNGSYIAGGLVLLIALIYIAYRKITANISKEAHLE